MKTIFRTLLLSLTLTLTTAMLHADVNQLPTTIIGGKAFHYYEVQPKETIYSLCHKLDVTHDYLLQCNPSAADGLKSGTMLYFPATDKKHTVQKGETLYGIAHQYGISIDNLIEANPDAANGVKTDQVLTIPTASATQPQKAAQPKSKFEGYLVQKGETFYSIAHSHGITVAQLETANPDVATLKPGQVLNIPIPGTAAPTQEAEHKTPTPEAKATNPSIAPSAIVQTTPTSPVATSTQKRTEVAVLLPFMLDQARPDKQAMRYTEFYKGLLLAVDSLRSSGIPMTVRTFDTAGSMDRVNAILANPQLKNASVIIAPDNTAQLDAIAEWGRKHDILVYNPFVVKDDGYLTNPVMVNANIPSQMMLDRAADALAGRYAHYTPVFVWRNNGATDKADFVAAAKQELQTRGVEYKELKFDGKLLAANLKALDPDAKYIFIPASGKQAELNRILPGLQSWRDSREGADPMRIRVFGYPEWTTFRGETLSRMHDTGTVVYSRFFTDDDSWRTHKLERQFQHYYGNGMDEAVPRQGLLGFDTGMYLFKHLKNHANYQGVQNPIHVIHDGEGWRNDALWLISYRPGGVVETIDLQ